MTTAQRKRAYRRMAARMRAQAMRPIVVWVPDPRSPFLAAEARRQSLAVAQSPQEEEDMRWVEAMEAMTDDPLCPENVSSDEAGSELPR